MNAVSFLCCPLKDYDSTVPAIPQPGALHTCLLRAAIALPGLDATVLAVLEAYLNGTLHTSAPQIFSGTSPNSISRIRLMPPISSLPRPRLLTIRRSRAPPAVPQITFRSISVKKYRTESSTRAQDAVFDIAPPFLHRIPRRIGRKAVEAKEAYAPVFRPPPIFHPPPPLSAVGKPPVVARKLPSIYDKLPIVENEADLSFEEVLEQSIALSSDYWTCLATWGRLSGSDYQDSIDDAANVGGVPPSIASLVPVPMDVDEPAVAPSLVPTEINCETGAAQNVRALPAPIPHPSTSLSYTDPRSPSKREADFLELKASCGPKVPQQLWHRGTRYDIHGMLGEGGFGCVVYATATTPHPHSSGTTTQEVAIKILNKRWARMHDDGESIKQEADLLARVTKSETPFITGLLAAFEDKHSVYLVMRYYYESLFERLVSPNKPSIEDIRIYAAELVLALGTLHEEFHIVHRDIKPSNILLSPSGHVVLGDLGISEDCSQIEGMTSEKFRNHVMKSLAGTQGYHAPEMLVEDRREKGYKPNADLWAVGAVLLELAIGSGRPFFDPKNDEKDSKKRTVKKALQISRYVKDKDLCDLIKRLLKRNAEERLTLAEMKEHPFFATLNWDLVAGRAYQLSYVPGRHMYPFGDNIIRPPYDGGAYRNPVVKGGPRLDWVCAYEYLVDPLHLRLEYPNYFSATTPESGNDASIRVPKVGWIMHQDPVTCDPFEPFCHALLVAPSAAESDGTPEAGNSGSTSPPSPLPSTPENSGQNGCDPSHDPVCVPNDYAMTRPVFAHDGSTLEQGSVLPLPDVGEVYDPLSAFRAPPPAFNPMGVFDGLSASDPLEVFDPLGAFKMAGPCVFNPSPAFLAQLSGDDLAFWLQGNAGPAF